jgi:hypothetical protein
LRNLRFFVFFLLFGALCGLGLGLEAGVGSPKTPIGQRATAFFFLLLSNTKRQKRPKELTKAFQRPLLARTRS